ncbi:hypothetical protein [Bacteroides mediterraneensis]|uniref:hypothetical protein n=1 Tax=Bacteroides mediterraneensis TaxID=1841856 RepID=UPI0026EF2B7E|nr:hypothetical protein [Bacteroides mediterraneensis]
MKKIHFILIYFILVLFTACQEDNWATKMALQEGESLFTFSLPEPVVASRATLGGAGSEPISNLHILVFNEQGFFLANATADVLNQTSEGGQCTVKLPVSNRKCRLHFIANYDSYETYTSTDTENSVIGSMVTGNNQDAYWGMVEVNSIPETGLKLEIPVELIRNFAKISLTSETSDIEILKYTVYNTASEGLVAPYNPQNGTFADFNVTGTNPYEAFKQKNPDYHATTMGDIQVNELEPENSWKTIAESYYVYERNQDNSDIPTALIVKAHYNGGNGAEGDYYYKLDIVQFMSDTYQTVTYNLLRNFEYKITINGVKSAGYATAEEAMNAAASNNLATSVQVSKVKRITDGNNILEVSSIDTLIVKKEQLILTYQYYEGDVNQTETLGKVKVNYELNEKIFSEIDVSEPGVIKLTPIALPSVLENQELVVATESGLSRHITVRVHEPFKFVAVDCQRKVKAEQKAEFVVIMELPMGLPTAAFPLNLTIDMEANTLYPNSSKNHLPVNVTSPKNYTYDFVVDYNSYRQNRTQYCHFLTNTSQSATTVQISGACFEPTNPIGFVNEDTRSFSNIYFNDILVNGSNQITVPFGEAKAANLRFNMSDQSPVTIYVRYLEQPTSTTGNLEPIYNGVGALNGYKYTPNASGVQLINFVTKEYIAAETIELFSENYEPALISYTNPWVNMEFMIPTGIVPDGRIVKVYDDAYYQNFIADLSSISGGKTVMRSLAGYQPENMLYFLYQNGNTSYRGEMSVRELIEQGGGENKLAAISLKQK